MNDVGQELTPRHVLYALVGAALLLVMGVFVAASGLIVPPWGTAVLVGVWLLAVVMALRSWREKMFAPVMWGVLVGLFWIAFVAFGGGVLGWTA